MIQANYKSHRDSAARVVQKNGAYYRYIFQEYKPDYDRLMESGLYAKLVELGLMIPHREIQIDLDDASIYKLLYPDQIEFQTYPFEWSFTQYQKVVQNFLTINQIALQYGMILKDATPYNFYLKGGRAILFDTSSFKIFKDGDVWMAYRQFCEELLSPLALMYYQGQRWAKFYRTHIHGIPLAFVSKQLPLKSWLNSTCLIHVHLHAKFDNNSLDPKSKNSKGFNKDKLLVMLKLIQSNISNWKTPYHYKNHWATYYNTTVESEQYLMEKESIVDQWISLIAPKLVVDLGANTGRFSKIASKYASVVIALEDDPQCVDKMEQILTSEKIENIYPLVEELSNPSPSLGILNKEVDSLFDRVHVDLVLSLALIHHLCITNYMSMDQVATMLASFTNQYTIVEFIPREDEKVKLLMNGREEHFTAYSEENYIREFEKQFELLERMEIKDSLRKLYLWKKLK